MGVEGTYQCRAKTTEARNVKIGMLIPLTMYVTTKKDFLNNLLSRHQFRRVDLNLNNVLGSLQ